MANTNETYAARIQRKLMKSNIWSKSPRAAGRQILC